MGQRNHALDGGCRLFMRKGNFVRDMCQPIMKYNNYAGLWCECIIPAAEYLHSSALGTEHLMDKSICRQEGGSAAYSQITLGNHVYLRHSLFTISVFKCDSTTALSLSRMSNKAGQCCHCPDMAASVIIVVISLTRDEHTEVTDCS